MLRSSTHPSTADRLRRGRRNHVNPSRYTGPACDGPLNAAALYCYLTEQLGSEFTTLEEAITQFEQDFHDLPETLQNQIQLEVSALDAQLRNTPESPPIDIVDVVVTKYVTYYRNQNKRTPISMTLEEEQDGAAGHLQVLATRGVNAMRHLTRRFIRPTPPSTDNSEQSSDS